MTFLRKRFVPVLLIVPLFLPFASFAQQTNSLDTLQAAYEQARQTIESDTIISYSNALVAVGNQLKQKGDVDTYLLLNAEMKRLAEDNSVEEGVPNTAQVIADTAKKVMAERNTRIVAVIKQYIASLEERVKQLMTADKVDEAKTVKDALESARFELADFKGESSKEVAAGPINKLPKTAVSVSDSASDKSFPKNALEYNRHHYAVIMKTLSWYAARTACTEEGGHLVIITSKDENDFCIRIGTGRGLWIGCSDHKKQGDWRWVDGTKVSAFGVPTKLKGSHTSPPGKAKKAGDGHQSKHLGEIPKYGWLPGQPNNRGTLEHFGAFVPVIDNNGRTCAYGWNDVRVGGHPNADGFGSVRGYICEWDK